MEILFKNKTKYTKETYQKFLQFNQNKFGNKYTFTTIVIILLLSFCFITNLQFSNYSTAFIFIITLIIFFNYRFFSPKKRIQKELKTEKFEKEKEFTFTFCDKFFVISDNKDSEKIKYWKLHRVYETNEFFYLYVDKTHAFLLNKSTFSEGNTCDFYKFIKKKIWYKI